MTYRNLVDILQELSEEQLDMDVTVCTTRDDEYFAADKLNIVDENDEAAGILDEGHHYLTIEA